MNPFDFYNPTRILFGEGRINELRALLPVQARILLIYDEDAVMQNGVYAEIKEALVGFTVIEFRGIKPNPDYDFLMKALPLIRDHALDFILAAGGTWVVDASKFIAAAAKYQGDPWALTDAPFLVREALPLGVIQTHPASGTEVNQYGVISRRSLKLTRAFSGEALFPKFAILDPTLTLTLSPVEMTDGIITAFSYAIEQYVTIETATPLQDRQAEAQLLTIIESARAILKNPKDLEARAIFMWCAASVSNGHLQTGNVLDFAAHRISHVFTALYGLNHPQALVLTLVPTLSVLRKMKHQKLCRYGRIVWGHQHKNEDELIDAALCSTHDFFVEVRAQTDAKGSGLPKGMISEVLKYFKNENMYPLGECHPVYEIEAMAILSQVLK